MVGKKWSDNEFDLSNEWVIRQFPVISGKNAKNQEKWNFLS